MNGILRSTLLFCWGWKLQRPLFGASLLLTVGAAALQIVQPSGYGNTLWSPILDVLLLMCVWGALLMGGTIFRAASAPRTLRLIPYARLQLALGVLLAEVLLAACLTLNLALVHRTIPTLSLAYDSVTSTFFATLAAMTLTVFWQFFLFSDSLWCRWATVTTILIFVSWLIRSWQLGIEPLRMATAGFASVTLAAWALFSTWYFRTERINPPNLQDGWGTRRRIHTQPTETRGAALNIYLLGQKSTLRACWPDLDLIMGYNAVAVLIVLGQHRPLAIDLSYVLILTFLFAGSAGLRLASPIAQRARALWIRSGCSRQELFNTAERLSLRCLACVSVPTLAVCAVEWIALPHGPTDWRYLLLILLLMLFCDVYLGLAGARQGSPTVPAIVASAAFAIVVFLPHDLRSSWDVSSPVVLIPTAEVLVALSLRFLAQRRWQRLDWLICKPTPLSSKMASS